MKIQTFLFLATIIASFAHGRPFPPPHHHRGVRGVVSKPFERRNQEDMIEKSKKSDDGRLDNCFTNPLSRLEGGCPCFTPETLMNQMDYTKAWSCEFYQSVGTWDYTYESMYFHAYASQNNPDGSSTSQEPLFQVEKQTGSDGTVVDRYCYISLYESKHDGGFGVDDIFGESHSNYMDIGSLTEGEYVECVNAMVMLKSQLPANCLIHEGEY